MSQDIQIETSDAETAYRQKHYPDLDEVLKPDDELPNCTVCSDTLDKDGEQFAHPLLKVLICKSCFVFYNKGEFSSDEDGTDKYCRWCGQGGSLYLCSKCRCAFCKKCVKRNCNKKVQATLEDDDWECFVCDVKPLWKARAYCWAVIESKKVKSRLAKMRNKAALEELGKNRTAPHTKSRRRHKPQKSSSESDSSSSEKQLKTKKSKKKESTPSSSSDFEEPKQTRNSRAKPSKKKHRSSDQSSSEGGAFLDTTCKVTGDVSESDVELVSETKPKKSSHTKKKKSRPRNSSDVSESDIEIVSEILTKKSSRTKKKTSRSKPTTSEDDDSDSNYSEESSDRNAKRATRKASQVKKKTRSQPRQTKSSESDSEADTKVERRVTKRSCVQKRSNVKKSDSSESESDHETKARQNKKLAIRNSKDSNSETERSESEIKNKRKSLGKYSHKPKTSSKRKELQKESSDENESLTEKTTNKSGKEELPSTSAEIVSEIDFDSDGTSKQGAQPAGNEWFFDLIGDFDKFSTQTSKKLAAIRLNVPQTMEPEHIDSTCKMLYKHVKKSIKFLEIYKSNITDDYSVWKNKLEKKAKKKQCNEDKFEPPDSPEPPTEVIVAKETSEPPEITSSVAEPIHKPDEGENNEMQVDTTVKKVKRKIGPKSKVQRKSTDDEEPMTEHVGVAESVTSGKSIDTDSTVVAPGECKTDESTISNETILSSLAVLEAEASKVGETLSKEAIDNLSKTLDSKLTRQSIDPFEDDDMSINDDKSGLEEDNGQSILDIDTECESNQETEGAAGDSQTTNFVEENEEISSITDTDKILNETTLEQINVSDINSEGTFGEAASEKEVSPEKEVSSEQREISPDREESPEKELITEREITPEREASSEKESTPEKEKTPEKASSPEQDSFFEEPDATLLCESSDMEDETEVHSDATKDEAIINALLASSESDEDNASVSTSQSKRKIGPKSKVPRPDSCDSIKMHTIPKKKIGPKSKMPRSDDSELVPQLSLISNADEFDDDEKLQCKCFVKLVKQPREARRNGGPRTKSGYSSDQEIANLIDLSSLEKTRAGSEGNAQEKKSKTKSKKKKEDDKVEDASSSSDEFFEAEEGLEENPLLASSSAITTADDMAAQAILISSDSDASDGDATEADKKKKKSGEASKVKVKPEKENSDGSGSEKETKKRSSWRNAKELTERLSDLGTSDEDDIFQKMKSRQDKKDGSNSDEELSLKRRNTQEKKKKAKRQVFSDSDIEVIGDDEKDDSDGDSSDVFQPIKKNKRSRSSSDSSNNDSDESTKKKPVKRRRIRKPASDSDSDSDNMDDSQKTDGTPGKRKNIRKVLKGRDLEKTTRQAAKEEEDRKRRIAERQALYNQLVEGKQIEKGSVLQELVLDFDENSKETILEVDRDLVAKLKPHQAQGVKFMWDALFESVKLAKKNKGSGCILAHCMGLGKTFQVVSLVHTVLTHPELELGIRTVLIVTPLSTVNNWCSEFSMWLKDIGDGDEIQCFNFTQAKPRERAIFLKNWHKYGGVAVMGYDMFRNLSTENKRQGKATTQTYQKCLIDPGPDLVVCDEGHMLKNEKSKLSQSMSRVKTYRRVALTGTPLQNNLLEYHCMIQFVKPNLLGKKNEFSNRFVHPIKNGQCADSTPRDVLIMKRRAHVLHKMLEGCVQRFDYSVLTPLLKPKFEYVIKIRLTELQIKLYQYYLDNLARQAGVNKGASLFQDYQNLQRLWTHPMVMKLRADRDDDKFLEDEGEDTEGSLKEFIDDDDDESAKSTESSSSSNSSSDSDVVCEEDDDTSKKRKKKTKKEDEASKKYRTRGAVANGDVVEQKESELRPSLWWHEYVNEEDFDILAHSNKMMLLFSILRECEAIGDKLLVFSQSLFSLNLIEIFLGKVDDANQENADSSKYANLKGSWSLGMDYFRIDGQTSTDHRSMWCKTFNNPNNTRARLFLISTRAGGLGINMVGANRVVLFDASWNPSNDVQSIFRVFRFGQVKPCYIYRFLAAGTMEEKIYDRQVTKLALSGRVVDEHQIDRHFNAADLEELYSFNPNGMGDERPTMLVPKDRLLAELLKEHPDQIESYHEHDSLLENKPEENLTEEERQAAWNDYEHEKNMHENRLLAQEQHQARLQAQQELWRQQVENGMKGMNQLFPGGFDADRNLQDAFLNLKARVAMNMAHGNTSNAISEASLQGIFAQAMTGNPAAMELLQRVAGNPHPLQANQQAAPLVDLSNDQDLTPNADGKPKLMLRKDLY